MKKIGRPKIVIDYEAVKRLAAIQCTQAEISSFLGVSVDTLARDTTFCGLYKEAIERGKMSLRRYQWKALEAGNTTMLIWLGKQYLGQKDQQHQTVTGEGGKPIELQLIELVAVKPK